MGDTFVSVDKVIQYFMCTKHSEPFTFSKSSKVKSRERDI